MPDKSIAYFTMEIALESDMPTYSGGLGALAGDTISSAADLNVPMLAVTLLHRKGCCHQHLDETGWQHEAPVEWSVPKKLEEMPVRTSVNLEGQPVHLRAWKYTVVGLKGYEVPIFFLDAELPENDPWGRSLTDFLYGGDRHYRVCQEIILGIGGVRMLRALGYEGIERYHMNEGHASLLTIELLKEEAQKAGREKVKAEDIEAVRSKCLFTTHTPVAAGHDQFPMEEAVRLLGISKDLLELDGVFSDKDNLNLTYLALNLSNYVNGVAKKHGEISQLMFAKYSIDAITNGVHAATWTSPPFAALFDKYIPGWRQDNFSLRFALTIPRVEVWAAHMQAKMELIDLVLERTGVQMDIDCMTLGFARRAAAYKRADLLITDIDRLKSIAENSGPFQLIYAGKAHPADHAGKEIIQRIIQSKSELGDIIKLVYLENYDKYLAKKLTSGVDVWLNTPKPPLEASGTSGMKAALNGVPSFSVLDGWWIEGNIEGVTGWAIGANVRTEEDGDEWIKDVDSLYGKLEHIILPLFYSDRDRFINITRHCIALNGSFFNTQRMLLQYVSRAYLR